MMFNIATALFVLAALASNAQARHLPVSHRAEKDLRIIGILGAYGSHTTVIPFGDTFVQPSTSFVQPAPGLFRLQSHPERVLEGEAGRVAHFILDFPDGPEEHKRTACVLKGNLDPSSTGVVFTFGAGPGHTPDGCTLHGVHVECMGMAPVCSSTVAGPIVE